MPPPRGRSRPGDQLEPAPDPRSQFQFPRMPLAEIQEDMNVYNRPVTREMLKAPTSKDVKGIFDHFIEEFYSKRPEDMAQPGFGCLDSVDYPELYEDAIPSLHFLRECQKMFSAANFDEFGLRDVFAPSKSRFHWQISALINFNKFRQTRLASFEEMAKNADDLLERERTVVSEKSELQREITGIEEVRASEEAEVESIREIVSEFTLEINKLHKQQKSLTDQTREAKVALTQKTENATGLKVRKMTEREEVDAMKSRVVTSPDRVKGELEDMRETLTSEKDNVGSMEKRTRNLNVRSDGLRKADQSVQQACSSASDCLACKSRMEELEHAVRGSQAKKKEHDAEVESIKGSTAHCERLIESVAAKVTRIDEQRSEIDNNTSESDRKLAERSKQLEAEEQQVARVLEEKASTIVSCQNQIEECVRTFADELEKFTDKQELLSGRFTAYHTDITKVTDLVRESNQQALEECEKSLADCEAVLRR